MNGLLLSFLFFVIAASSLADTIGEARIQDASGSHYIAIREYPILAGGSGGRTSGASGAGGAGGTGEVDPRFLFQVTSEKTDEGDTWSVSILLTPAGRNASSGAGGLGQTGGAVTTKEYLALVDQCLDRFRKDLPDARVYDVSLDLTDDSKVLADILQKLRPRFQARAKNPPPAPNKIMEGVAIALPPGAEEVFVGAANDSSATQRLGADMARRLGRRYLRVINWADRLSYDHRPGPPSGKTWKELLQDPHLGIDLETLRLTFLFRPRH